MNLALFDFDGTITTINTGADFGFFINSTKRLLIGRVVLLPYILSYKLGMVDIKTMRRIFCNYVYKDITEDKICAKGKKYAQNVIPQHVRKEALERIYWHKQRGDTVVVVSASFSYYLAPWCAEHGLELICNDISTKNGVLTGHYQQADCCAEQKPLRVQERFNRADFDKVYAYGDTHEDHELLNFADERYYRYFE